MALAQKIGGDISLKSVVASGRGLVFAENMMYKHSVTVSASDGSLKTTIPDTVKLSDYGFDQYTGASYQGAPVEVAFAPDDAHAYVTTYSMYGKGFGPEGNDNCQKNNKVDSSFVYRIDTSTAGHRSGHRRRQGAEVRRHHARWARPVGEQLVQL